MFDFLAWLIRNGIIHRSPKRIRKRSFRTAWASEVQVLEARVLLSAIDATQIAIPTLVASHASGQGITPEFTSGPTGYTPAQIRAAYGFDKISFNGAPGDGRNTTIAIVDAYNDPNIAGDLQKFDAQFGLTDPVLTVMNQNGSTNPSTLPAANSGWITEIALDVEWAHAIAPGANILLVEANSASYSDLMTAVNTARNYSGVVAVSMSWEGGEFSGETTYDSTFTTPANHGGVTFVAASGDTGAPADYPGSSPNVLTVGGTTLYLNPDNSWNSETGWSGSGGGVSSLESQPAYQKGVVIGSTTNRVMPDVSYDSDPNTGFPVYDSYNNGTVTPWGQWGGTSDAAPQWAALIAIADQGRAAYGKGSLDGATQTLPGIYAMSQNDFHDIVSGTSTGQPQYTAGTGFDLVTGRGTPIANLVVNDLIGASPHFGVTAAAGTQAGSALNFSVTTLNADNTTNTGYLGTITFTSTDPQFVITDPSVTKSGNTYTYTFSPTDQGSHTFTGVVLKTAGNQGITVTDLANQLAGGASVQVSAGVADHLLFGQQPGSASAGGVISPAVTVDVVDLYNNIVTGFTPGTGSVTVALGPGSSSGTLGGTMTASVVNGIATFNNLAVSASGTYSLIATTSGLAPLTNGTAATSNPFNVLATTSIESFDSGSTALKSYSVIGSRTATATVSTSAKHDGSYGLADTSGNDWIYKNPSPALVKAGDTLSVWLKFATSTNGTASFGFGSSASGTLALVASASTKQLLLQQVNFTRNASQGGTITQLAAVNQTFQPNHWYRLEVDWSTTGSLIGKLYDSNGTTLLGTVTYSTPTSIKSGGIAFRATGTGTKYWDTVTDSPNVNSFAAKGTAIAGGSGFSANGAALGFTSDDLAGFAMVDGLWNNSDKNRHHD